MKKLRPIVFRKSRIPKILSKIFRANITGLAIFPFTFINNTNPIRTRYSYEKIPISKRKLLYSESEIINHEQIHFQQQLESGVIGFYLIFVIEFAIKMIKYRNVKKANRNLSCEIEAYQYMTDLDYLEKRKRFTWLKNIF